MSTMNGGMVIGPDIVGNSESSRGEFYTERANEHATDSWCAGPYARLSIRFA
jgi:hypothetical protein